jgi:DNA gyrase subunit A
MEDLIADESVAVTISHEGYVKRLALTEYRLQGRGGKGVTGADMKEGDFVERLIVTTNHQYLLVLTQTGQLHWLRVYDVPEASRTSRGRALVNLLQVDQGDRIAACVPVRTFEQGYLVTATAKGTIRKTPLSGFARPKRGGIIGVLIEEGDRLVGAAAVMPGQQVMLATRNGKAIRFLEAAARAMGRASVGVRGIKLLGDDQVVSLVIVEPGMMVMTVCENGYGKRTTIGTGEEGGAKDYPLTNRGGQGVNDIRVSERNGKVVAAKAVSETDEFIAITQEGMVVRSRVADVRSIGRGGQGVTVMDVAEGDRVVSVGLIESEEATPEAAPGAAPTEQPSDEPATDEISPAGGTPEDGTDAADGDADGDEGDTASEA